ncbi:hypothetical protein L484_011311 [Morus notabilis]|uniref:Uncharacterized protein n=1 Tax=Morus notabilis TaxID=981085 RepID=W9RSE0_9ROSA|nr:hypothetical protein L484_011311 [Morus notabilis]
MNCTHCTVATVASFPYSPPSNLTATKTLQLRRSFTRFLSANHHAPRIKTITFRVRASASDNESGGGGGGTRNWVNRLPTGAIAADKVLRLIAGATASPICQYVSSPSTFLHSVDPRIKLVMPLSEFLGKVTYSTSVRINNIPGPLVNMGSSKTGMDGPTWKSVFTYWNFIHHVGAGFRWRTIPCAIENSTSCNDGIVKSSFIFERIFLFDNEARTITFYKEGLIYSEYSRLFNLHSKPLFSTWFKLFLLLIEYMLRYLRKVFQSASLCLTTTTPEQLASALRWFMLPLTHIGVPVAEIILTLMLSLRFISLVFDEESKVRNVALGIISRRINWEQLTMLETIDLFFAYFRRIFKNIFNHAEQISQAMIVRGFRGDSKSHNIYFLSDSSFGKADLISLLCLVGVVGASLLSDYYLV